MQPTRNNRGRSHENGSIESPHGHFKRRLQQALLLRESLDFDSVSAYQTCIDSVVEQLNIPCLDKLQQERPHLQQLPTHRYLDYENSVSKSLVTAPSRFCTLHSAVAPDWSALDNLSLPRPFAGFVGTKQVVTSDACAHLTAAVPVASLPPRH